MPAKFNCMQIPVSDPLTGLNGVVRLPILSPPTDPTELKAYAHDIMEYINKHAVRDGSQPLSLQVFWPEPPATPATPAKPAPAETPAMAETAKAAKKPSRTAPRKTAKKGPRND